MVYGSSVDAVGNMLGLHFSKVTGYPITGPYTAMGWIRSNKIIAHAIFNDYTGANIELHFHGPKELKRQMIRDICSYVFHQIHCVRLTVKPYCTNEKLLQVVKRIGFVPEFIQKDYYLFDNKLMDAAVFKLTKDAAFKWLHKEIRLNERF